LAFLCNFYVLFYLELYFYKDYPVSPSLPPVFARGRFFEDFVIGDIIHHATPRTLTHGDAALYQGLFGARFAVQSADTFAQAIGYPQAPLDDLLVFHTVFGKTVPDVSLNAVANLGYAELRFLQPVYAGDTLNSISEVIGLKENSSQTTGVVYVRSKGFNQHQECVLDYIRWVMVNKRDAASPAPAPVVPSVSPHVPPEQIGMACPLLRTSAYNLQLAGSSRLFDDYHVGEKIDHADGITVEEAEHQIATRLYQNTARIHFDAHMTKQTRFGRRLIYGGHVMSIARALSFNGLQNAFHLAAINSGRHVNPLFAGDTIYAWSEILATSPIPHRSDVGALRIRTIATKDHACTDFPDKQGDMYPAHILLDLDYWVLMART
jgi:2-methylfumaryl-CoA hydratase